MKQATVGAAFAAVAMFTFGEVVPVGHIPPPGDVMTPPLQVVARDSEKPVEVKSSEIVIAENAYFRMVKVEAAFTNPNSRQMSWDWTVPLPEGATVCGYELEISGVLVPGVVVEKERARVAFESEKAKKVDPGVVEKIGNSWRTRIFPLLPGVPRRATVTYVSAKAPGDFANAIYERDGDDIFVAASSGASEDIAIPDTGFVLWDASQSAEKSAGAWLETVRKSFPENGKWSVVVFRNEPEAAVEVAGRDALVAFLQTVVYDGATDIDGAVRAAAGAKAVLFTDDMPTWGSESRNYEENPDVIIPGRKSEAVKVARIPVSDVPEGAEVKTSRLLATVWAARRIKEMEVQAESRKDEILALGRRWGVASSVTSLIVLETLDQYLEHKIEPPMEMAFHDEWVRRRAAMDDPIQAREERIAHERDLLQLWKERVEWWNNPIPRIATPKSGLFDVFTGGRGRRESARGVAAAEIATDEEGMADAAVAEEAEESGNAVFGSRALAMELEPQAAAIAGASPGAAQAPAGGAATINVQPWNPDTPYLRALDAAADPYAEYLKERAANGKSPAFYMDVAGWFFKKDMKSLAVRILSNMAELSLEDAAVCRAMGWRLREAGEYDAAVALFRKALKLRGEEGQSRRDLALVLSERGKTARSVADLAEAAKLLYDAAFTPRARRSGRRSNDRQVSIVALEELNALIAWCKALGLEVELPEMPEEFIRELPLKLRIVMSWDADETDVDIHVLEPNGEEAYYSHRRTSRGGFVGEDVTTGYGPEEYLRKDADSGTYRVLAHYYASHQTALTGPTAVTATIYTDWGTASEKREILTLRLDKPKDKVPIGDIKVD